MKINSPLVFLLIWSTSIYAQDINPSVLASAGESSSTNNFQLDWTLGEVAVTTLRNSDSQITQGFHQPDYLITSLVNIHPNIGSIDIFPIPATDFVNVNVQLNQPQAINYLLYNSQGQLIRQVENTSDLLQQFNLNTLSAGTYFLQIQLTNNQHSSSFKIIKL